MQPNENNLRVLIYTRDDVVLVLRREIYAEVHRHHAIQLTLALEQDFRVMLDHDAGRQQAFIIDHDQSHLVEGQVGWVATFLINPEAAVAGVIQRQLLQGATGVALDSERTGLVVERLRAGLEQTLSCTDVDVIVRQLFDSLLEEESYEHTVDPRIVEALAIIGWTAEKKLPAQKLSENVFLSSGRFGHLFKDVVGVPLRRYLLWRRLLAALEHIAAGNTFTFAAHAAGFTDSAHLSRTFRQMFGLSLSNMFARREQIYFTSCTQQTFSI